MKRAGLWFWGGRRLKRIERHTDAELNVAINTAIEQFGRDEFFIMLHGIDAYMERRKRRAAERKAEEHSALMKFMMVDDERLWGQS